MSNTLYVSDHPLVKHKLAKLRDTKTKSKQFRDLIREIAVLLAYEGSRKCELKSVTISTPVADAPGEVFKNTIALVPILRAGLGMLEGTLEVLPFAVTWHLGLYRNEETLQPVQYYNKMREEQVSQAGTVFVLDPMLATGGSLVAAIKTVKDKGAKNVKVLSILAAPEGVKRVQSEFPDVEIYLAGLDERLNDVGYIVPGLGDAGDRQYGTD
mmetsp:Transcript_37919/g.81700  ORF Transcript_37919/g.81700 Transcript_37919/m.81700 type:complete len:212 (-) Transcript_37919:54-689(-)